MDAGGVVASSKPMSMKEKVDFIRSAMPQVRKKDVITILQSCNYNVAEAIATLGEDGGRRVLDQWTTPRGAATALAAKKKQSKRFSSEKQSKKDVAWSPQNETRGHMKDEHEKKLLILEQRNEEDSVTALALKHDPLPTDVLMPPPPRSKNEELMPAVESQHLRSNSMSSDVSTASSASAASGNFRKQIKELHRVSNQLPRYKNMLNENLEHSEKMIKTAFTEFRNILEEREADLVSKLVSVRSKATTLLQKRTENAEKLLTQAENIATCNPAQAAEIKEDMKYFLLERRIDEELATLKWFSGKTNDLAKSLSQFGKVSDIRHVYSERKRNIGGGDQVFAPKSATRPSSLNQKEKACVEENVIAAGKESEVTDTATSASKREPNDLRMQAELHEKLKIAVTMQQKQQEEQQQQQQQPQQQKRPRSQPQFHRSREGAAKQDRPFNKQQYSHRKKENEAQQQSGEKGGSRKQRNEDFTKKLENGSMPPAPATAPLPSPPLSTFVNGKESQQSPNESPTPLTTENPLPQRQKKRRKREVTSKKDSTLSPASVDAK